MEVLNRVSDGLKRDYSVLIQPKELEQALSAKLQETAKKVRIDGFRPGKVPVDVIKHRYGEALKEEAKKDAVTNAVNKIIKDEKLTVSFTYSTNIEKDDEKGLEFSLKFEVLPTFELKPLDNIELKKHVVEITDKEVNEILESVRKEQKNWVKDEKAKKVAEGHKVTVDMVLVSDKKHKNNALKELDIVIGDKSLVGDFWKNLIGAKIDETREFAIEYPANFGDKSLAGKKMNYTATIKQIFKAEEFKLNDEFAKAMGYENLEKMKAWAKSHAIKKYDYMAREIMSRDLLEKMSKMYDFDVPENMIKAEYPNVEQQISAEAKRLGKEFTPAIKDECLKIAKERVRLGCVVSEIAKKEKIAVTRSEVAQAIKNIAMMYPGHEKSIIDMYSRSDAVRAIAGPILENKVIDYLLGKLKTKEEKCSVEELVAIDEEPFDFFKDDGKKAETKKKAAPKKKEEKAEKEEVAPKKRSCRTKKSAE